MTYTVSSGTLNSTIPYHTCRVGVNIRKNWRPSCAMPESGRREKNWERWRRSCISLLRSEWTKRFGLRSSLALGNTQQMRFSYQVVAVNRLCRKPATVPAIFVAAAAAFRRGSVPIIHSSPGVRSVSAPPPPPPPPSCDQADHTRTH